MLNEHNEDNKPSIEGTVEELGKTSPSAAKLLEKIYESAENELISLTEFIPELKTNEMFQHMLVMAMIGQYMTGLNIGASLPEDLREDCHEEVGLIGDILGFDSEEMDET